MYMISPTYSNPNINIIICLCYRDIRAACSPNDFLQAEKVSHEYSNGMYLACPMIGSLGGLGGSKAD